MNRILMGIVLAFGVYVSGVLSMHEAYAQETVRGQFSSATLWVGDAKAAAGGTLERELLLEIALDDGWKTYWRSPGDAGFPLTLDATGSENAGVPVLHWPYPHRFIEEWGLQSFGFKHVLALPITVPVNNPDVPLNLQLKASYAVCSDICITEDISFAVRTIAPEEKAEKSLGEAWALVPVANGDRGFAVIGAYITEERSEGGTLEVMLSSYNEPFGDDTPELFVEGPAGVRFPDAKRVVQPNPKQITLQVPYEIALPAKTLAGSTITLTVVHQDKAIEMPALMTNGVHEGNEGGGVPGGDGTLPADGPLAPDNNGEDAVPQGAGDTPLSLGFVIALALLGGLILNVMPCVLPVLSLKLMTIVKHGGGDLREVRKSFLATAVGIWLSFAVLAMLTASAREAGMAVGWGFHFQSSGFISFLALLVGLFALNLFGVFEIALPQWLNTHIYDRHGTRKVHRQHWIGDVATGALAALMATPCTAPFLGTAVGFALARGSAEIWSVFMALGTGLALPYLFAVLVPHIVTRLPKPGSWMARVKHLMGVLMAAAALWLFWVLAQQVGHMIAVIAMGLGAATAWCLHHRARTDVGMRRLSLGMAAVLTMLAGLVVPNLLGHGEGTPAQTPEAVEAGAITWLIFDERAIDEYVSMGKVVFVDITADWCLTCKANKLFVLETEAIKAELGKPDVVLLKGDMTVRSPVLEAYLKRYGRFGIPFNIVFGPASPQGIVLPELLSRDAVVDAITKARG